MARPHPFRFLYLVRVPQGQRIIYPYLLNKIWDVTHEDHRAFIAIKGFCNDWDMSEIDMIRRLIENEQSGRFER